MADPGISIGGANSVEGGANSVEGGLPTPDTAMFRKFVCQKVKCNDLGGGMPVAALGSANGFLLNTLLKM